MSYSKLHNQCSNSIIRNFPELHIRENVRPSWLVSSDLTRLELDIYIEEIGVAIEIQGAQHYQYNKFFHKSYDDFLRQQRHDREKRFLCIGRGIKLVEVSMSNDIDAFIFELKKSRDKDTLEFRYSKPYFRSFRRTTKYRRRRKNRRLRAAGLLPPVQDVIFPRRKGEKNYGSYRQRRYARHVLNTEIIGDGWRVWGGMREHFLKYENGALFCDCDWSRKTGKICSHVIRINLEYGVPI